MDVGNIIYIIAIIAYFIYTATKKKANPEDMNQPGSPDNPQEQRKPVSFEDLLKEIRQGQGQKAPERTETRQVITEDRTRKTQDRRTFEPTEFKPVQETKKVKRYESFEGVVEERIIPERVKLSDQTRLYSDMIGLKSSIAVESIDADSGENRYKKLLSNPQSVKDAVILTEILNRKYF